jgi:phosphoglycolate phosphatase
MPWRLAIFDFDGTLADSLDWMRAAINEAARRHGFRQVSEAEIEMLRGQDNQAIIRHLGVPLWKLPAIAATMRRRMAEQAGEVPLFAGTGGMLRRLAAGGVTLAIVSSNTEANIRRILGPENAALIGHYGCGAAIFGKSARFRRILERSGVPAAQAIGIGDETRDIEAARAAGIASGAVGWGYARAELLRSRAPTVLFGSMEEIVALLLGHDQPVTEARSAGA